MKARRKRFALGALTALSLASLVACGQSGAKSSSPEPTPISSTPTPSVSEPSSVAPIYDTNKISWSWEASESGYTATATIPCTNGYPDQVIVAEVTSKKTDPTCTEGGSIVYTAKITFENEEHTDTKTVTVDALGHEYNPDNIVWSWTAKEDGSGYNVTAKIPCTRGDKDLELTGIEVTSKTTEATCTEKGAIVYTASVVYNGQTLTNQKRKDIEKTGHHYDYSDSNIDWQWTKTDDGYTVVAKVTCVKGDDTKEITATVAETNRVAATCTADGSVTYTATIKDEENKEHTNKKSDTLAMLGHDYDYDNLAWDWTESGDGYAAKATATCTRDGATTSAVATVTVVTTDATCETAGQKVYTAKATFDGIEHTSTKTMPLQPLGHQRSLVAAEGATTTAAGHEAYYKCERCHKLFADAEGTTEISAIPTISWVHIAAIDPTQSARGFKEFYLKSGTGEISFTAPAGEKVTDVTLTDEEKAAYIANDTNNVTIPSFDELDAMYSGHTGAMPYDGTFLATAEAAYALYSDAAKTEYGKDVDAMYTAWNNAYEVANPMNNWSSGWGGKSIATNVAYEDGTAGTVRHITLKEGLTTPESGNFRIDAKSTVTEGAKGLVLFVKGIADANIAGGVGQDITASSGYAKFKLGGEKQFDGSTSSSIDYIADGWYAVYFTDSTLIDDLNNSTKNTSLTINPNWGANDIYVSPLYAIKHSNYYGSDVQAFPNNGASDSTGAPTQNFNNVSYSDASLNWKGSNKIGNSTYYNLLLDSNVMEAKGNYTYHFGWVGVDGVNTSAGKGAMKKMVDGTLTSAYFFFYSSVDSITAQVQVRNPGNGWVNFDGQYSYTITIEGKGWHKVMLDNATLLSQFNAADGTKVGWINFTIKSGNTNNDIMRMSGIYGTLAD